MNEQIENKKSGRPFGSYKYKDVNGNPISVYEWRKQNHIWEGLGKKKQIHQKFEITLPSFIIEMINYLSYTAKETKEAIIQKAIVDFYNSRKQNEL